MSDQYFFLFSDWMFYSYDFTVMVTMYTIIEVFKSNTVEQCQVSIEKKNRKEQHKYITQDQTTKRLITIIK